VTTAQRTKREWERRLPDLGDSWTHWRLEGDGSLIAVVAGERLAEALALVETNATKYASIKAMRARVDDTGNCTAIDELRVEISNRLMNERMIGWLGAE